MKCLFLYLKLNKTFQIGTSTIHSNIICFHFDTFSFPRKCVNTPIDYLSQHSFGHFCCRVKQGKRLSKFLQNYTDSGTETTHLAGYNILVFKYAKISAGLPLLSIGAIRERSSKIRYCIIWRCLHLMFSTTNVSDKWNVRGFERMLSYEQYPEEKSRLWLSSFKKNWSTFMEDYST